MKQIKVVGIMVVLFMVLVLPLSANGNKDTSDVDTEKQTLVFWHWAEENQPRVMMWKALIEQFEADHPGVTVKRELKSFQEMEEKFRLVLVSGQDVPDISQANKGFSGAGSYVKDGLLTNLEDPARQYGWRDILSSTFLFVGEYNESGILGSGDLFGIPINGNFTMVYYNADLFDQLNIEVPTSLQEFEEVCDALLAADVTPIGLGTLDKWQVTHNWNDYAGWFLTEEEIINYQTLNGRFDYSGSAYQRSAELLKEHYDKGYYNADALGLAFNDVNQAFFAGEYGMYLTGSWMYSGIHENAEFNVGTFLLPGKRFTCGAGGDVMVVPKAAKAKELAYEFIDYNLKEEFQVLLANSGGVVARQIDLESVTDPANQRLNQLYNIIKDRDGFAFFMDWPIPAFWKEQGQFMDMIFMDQISTDEAMIELQKSYQAQVEDLR